MSAMSDRPRAPITLMLPEGEVTIPPWVTDHPSFLRWLHSGEVPDEVRVSYVNGDVWIETMPERLIAHNRLKTLVAAALTPIIDGGRLGLYLGDGMTFTSEEAGFTTTPDGIFVSRRAERTGRVRPVGGERSNGDTSLVGSPDLTVEVVSGSSADKDTEWLMSGYWNAGVREYWLVDGREDPVEFVIHRRGPRGYVATRKTDGWSRSRVLGREFRFVPSGTHFGRTDYRFEAR
jgi:Uma2 family endonuclease